MLKLTHLKKFIHSPKNLKDYVKKLTSDELNNLLKDLDELKNFSKERKTDKNPLIRNCKLNLSDQDYITFMDKLELFSHEKQIFALTQKENVLHFIGILAAILLGSFSGFVGLLTALGMVFSIEIFGVLLATVAAISLLIASIWNYQLRITNKESIENKKLLNFRIELLKKYNANKLNELLNIVSILKEELVEPKEIIQPDSKEEPIAHSLAESIDELRAAYTKSDKDDQNEAWMKSLHKLSTLFHQNDIDRVSDVIKEVDYPLEDPGFIEWFKKDASRILLKLLRESKNLLASAALGAVLGLVTLKLLAQIAILATLLTTLVGVAILASIIVIVVLGSMILALYDMYKKSRRTILKHNAEVVIEQENQLKDQLEEIEKELGPHLPSLLDLESENFSMKVHDTIFMQELVEKKLPELMKLLAEKNLNYVDGMENFLKCNPLAIPKLMKKVKDNIISNDDELNEFLNKLQRETQEELKPVVKRSYARLAIMDDYEAASGAFDLAKGNLNHLDNQQLLLAVKFIEHQTLLGTAYKFAQDNSDLINNIAKEITKRLSNPEFQNNVELVNLRRGLEDCKSMRKKVIAILLKENSKLQNCFKRYPTVLDENNSHSSDKQDTSESDEVQQEDGKRLIELESKVDNQEALKLDNPFKQLLKFDPHTVTINELISKKWAAANAYQETHPSFSFWQPSYKQNQKILKTFEHAGIDLNTIVEPV